MATIRTAIQLYDGMTPAFRSMTKAMNIVLSSFESLQKASHNAVDTSSIQTARNELARVEASFNRIEQEIREAEQAQQKFNGQVRSGQSEADKLMGKLKGAAAALGLTMGAKEVLNLSDTMTSTTARLDLMNDGLETTRALQDKIFAAANRSRSAYTDMAQVVSKLGVLAGDAFASNDEAIAFAEQMNKQFAIGGASAQEQTAAMYQLTQAMASGRLQGDEFRTIREAAPLLLQAIADYTGVSKGELQELAREGEVTADIIKMAMFRAAKETDARFQKLPYTFEQAWTGIQNDLLQSFRPLLEEIGKGAQWIHENWQTIEPIFWGLAGAVAAYAVSLGLAKIAQLGLNTALLGCPVLWIALGIGFLVYLIYKWVEAVGGLKVAWLIATDKIKTAWENTVVPIKAGILVLANAWDDVAFWFKEADVNIQNAMGDMKAGVLQILQDMTNQSVNIVNGFIELLNQIPGVSIEKVQGLTFAAEYQAQNEAEKQARNAWLQGERTRLQVSKTKRTIEIAEMYKDMIMGRVERQKEIYDARKEAEAAAAAAEAAKAGFDYDKMTAENTSRMAKSMDATEEDLKYLRDLAEQEVVNRFTTASINISMPVDAKINSEMDLDGVVAYLEEKVYETMESAAEGVHA